MKVFISWSGELSRDIAEIFRTWIPGVIQAVKPYYSPNDIDKGTRWSGEIAKELEVSKFGIICLTKENLDAPWIMFEAGALSKNLERTKVVPFLFGIEPADVKGPLVQFQAAKFEMTEVKKLMKAINADLGDQSLAPEVLDSVFEMWWPKLEARVSDCMKKHAAAKPKHGATRSEKDMLEEILALTRALAHVQATDSTVPIATPDAQRQPSFPRVLQEIINHFNCLVTEIIKRSDATKYQQQIEAFKRPFNFLVVRYGHTGIQSELTEIFSQYSKAIIQERDEVPF